MNNVQLFEMLLHAEKRGEEYAILTIICSDKDSSRKEGMMAVLSDGTPVGSIGGGPAEKQAITDAVTCIREGRSAEKSYCDIGEGHSAGTACGSFRLWIQVFSAKPVLAVFGAGHVGEALLHAGKLTGFRTILLDTRESAEIPDIVAAADEFIQISGTRESVEALPLPENTYIVAAMFSMAADQEVLAGALQKNCRYIGMIGSAKKKETIFGTLENQGFSHDALSAVHCPIGLPLGVDAPKEVAISILAEILQVKSQLTQF